MPTQPSPPAEGTWWCRNGHQCNRGSTICHTCGFSINDEKEKECNPAADISKLYEELVAKIVEAVPGIETGLHSLNNFDAEYFPSLGKTKIPRPITLEDILLSLESPTFFSDPSSVEDGELYLRFDFDGKAMLWHLGHSLSWHRDNAPETIRFLHSLLIP